MTQQCAKVLQRAVICKKPGRYLSFPDVVRTTSGKLLCAFRESDIHYPPDSSQTWMVLIESRDDGLTWENERRFPHQPRPQNQYAWHCPRLSSFSDGRIALICDLADPVTNHVTSFVSFSCDQGASWTEPIDTGMTGIIPDRLIELGPSEWISTVHTASPKYRKVHQYLFATADSGKTWSKRSVIAEDETLLFCEGSIVQLKSGKLACFLRENSFLHYPTFVAFSSDNGFTWTKPVAHPTHGHRPCVGLLRDERLLLTYRNVAGTPGLCAWTGSHDEVGIEPGGTDLRGDAVSFSAQGMRISALGRDWEGAEFVFFPMQSWETEVEFEASLSCLSGNSTSCAMRAGAYLLIQPDGIQLIHQQIAGNTLETMHLGSVSIDARQVHRYALHYCQRVVEVKVDGELCISGEIGSEPAWWQRKIAFGNLSGGAPSPVCFERPKGESLWRSASLRMKDPKAGEYCWTWDYRSGQYPNHYQRTRVSQLDTETAGDWFESGYSGWISLDNDRVYCVDYQRCDEEKPYIVGYTLKVG